MTHLESISLESHFAPPTGRLVKEHDHWSAVRVLEGTVIRHAPDVATTCSLVRAHVRLGALVPADVRAEAPLGLAAAAAVVADDGLCRWGVHRFTNGVHRFEAQRPSSARTDNAGAIVCVRPAPGSAADPAALPVAQWAGPRAATGRAPG